MENNIKRQVKDLAEAEDTHFNGLFKRVLVFWNTYVGR